VYKIRARQGTDTAGEQSAKDSQSSYNEYSYTEVKTTPRQLEHWRQPSS